MIDLPLDKVKVIREAARVLGRGDRLAVSDVIADPRMDERTPVIYQTSSARFAVALLEPRKDDVKAGVLPA